MNKRSYRNWIARSGFLALLAGVVALGTGCDAAGSLSAIAQTTATGIAVQTVGGFLQSTVGGILGG